MNTRSRSFLPPTSGHLCALCPSSKVLNDKRGSIDAGYPPILERLGINPQHYLNTMRRDDGNGFRTAMGTVELLRAAVRKLERGCLRGISEVQLLFGTSTG